MLLTFSLRKHFILYMLYLLLLLPLIMFIPFILECDLGICMIGIE